MFSGIGAVPRHDLIQGRVAGLHLSREGIREGVDLLHHAALDLGQALLERLAQHLVMCAFGFNVGNHLLQAHISALRLWFRLR